MGQGAIGLEYHNDLHQLESNPNYVEEMPRKGDSLLSYTLRYISNLISPPQAVGETYDIECIVIKKGVLGTHYKIQRNWKKFVLDNAEDETHE